MTATAPIRRPVLSDSALADHLPRRAALLVTGLALVCCLIAGAAGLGAALSAVAGFVLLRTLLLRRLGGFTGDGAGAMLELIETAALLTLALG